MPSPKPSLIGLPSFLFASSHTTYHAASASRLNIENNASEAAHLFYDYLLFMLSFCHLPSEMMLIFILFDA